MVNNEARWKAIFELNNPVKINSVKNTGDIKFILEEDKIIEMEITTPIMDQDNAVLYVKMMCNRVLDVIASLSGINAEAFYRGMTEITDNPIKRVHAAIKVTSTLIRLIDLDLTTENIRNILQNKDSKLVRQVAHYRRGLLSEDIVEKIREFYLVLEDENQDIADKYKYIRHVVSHPKVDHQKSKEEAIKLLGKPYFDPSSEKDINILKNEMEKLQIEARNILMKYLG